MGEQIKSAANKTVGQSIRTLRINNGWNQEYIANKLGISVPAFSKIETGVTDVNLSRLEQIAHIYEISLVQLMNLYNDGAVPINLDLQVTQKRLSEQEAEITALQRKVIELYEELRGDQRTSKG